MPDAIDYYRSIRLIRRVEERLMRLKEDGHVPGSMHLCNGQEAIPVGVASVLDRGDHVGATYRGHGWAIARGTSPAALFAELMGRDSTLNGGRAGSPFLSDPAHRFLGENSIVGAGVPIAIGAALSALSSGTGTVAIASIGDGAMNQGAVHESLNMAAVLKLPFVLIVENNRYAEMSPTADQTRIERLSLRGEGYGIPGTTIDGNDPAVVARAAKVAVDRARAGRGPTIIEALTERLVGHYSGDVQHYRPREEVAIARLTEPLVRLRQQAAGDPSLLSKYDEIDRVVDEQIEVYVAQAFTFPFPSPTTVLDHLYV